MPTESEPRYPVRVAASRSGVSPHVLRAWERRHRVVTPLRSEGGQRLYSDLDVARLRLLGRLTAKGHGIGRLARLSLEELQQLSDQDTSSLTSPLPDSGGSGFRSQAVLAARSLNAGELKAVLDRAVAHLGVGAFLEEVAGPAIRDIGHEWQDGTLSVGQEHMATSVFRQVLTGLVEAYRPPLMAPRLLVGTPVGQVHELGALMAGAAAALEGWEVIYLGPDLPASDIVEAARQAEVKAVALSVVHPADFAALLRDLEKVREGLGAGRRLFLGGSAVTQEPQQFKHLGARLLDSLAEFRLTLRDLAAPAGSG